jgi:hypothetical protein
VGDCSPVTRTFATPLLSESRTKYTAPVFAVAAAPARRSSR